jgi:hypothetical protein
VATTLARADEEAKEDAFLLDPGTLTCSWSFAGALAASAEKLKELSEEIKAQAHAWRGSSAGELARRRSPQSRSPPWPAPALGWTARRGSPSAAASASALVRLELRGASSSPLLALRLALDTGLELGARA